MGNGCSMRYDRRRVARSATVLLAAIVRIVPLGACGSNPSSNGAVSTPTKVVAAQHKAVAARNQAIIARSKVVNQSKKVAANRAKLVAACARLWQQNGIGNKAVREAKRPTRTVTVVQVVDNRRGRDLPHKGRGHREALHYLNLSC